MGKHRETLETIWGNIGNNIGETVEKNNTWGNIGKNMGKNWKKHGETFEKHRENMGKAWEKRGKTRCMFLFLHARNSMSPMVS